MHDNCQAVFGRLQATAFLKVLGVKGCHSLAGTSLGQFVCGGVSALSQVLAISCFLGLPPLYLPPSGSPHARLVSYFLMYVHTLIGLPQRETAEAQT